MINNIPFFILSTYQRQKLNALNNQVIEYSDKAETVEEGQENSALFIVLKCEAIVTRNDFPKVIINTLVEGALFCELSFLTQTLRATNILTKTRA